jgi:NAD(P)-dependent dehydrogenase (short-subunit alcohol dehydrogenase family)
MSNEKHDMVALVTGGAGGIGRATVDRLWRDGRRVVAIDLNEEALGELASGREGRVASLALDVTEDDAPRRALSFAENKFGPVQLLVNNVGIGAAKPVDATSDEEFDRFVSVNLRSVFRMSREAVRGMRFGASIVNVASTFGLVGYPGSSSYAATKAALMGLTRQMAVDYGPKGIRTNAVAPGLIATPLTAGRIASNRDYQRLLVGGTPFPRIGNPDDVANAIRFLSSDEAGFINGQVLAVDGGWSTTRFSTEM